jgi:hypothetical protein
VVTGEASTFDVRKVYKIFHFVQRSELLHVRKLRWNGSGERIAINFASKNKVSNLTLTFEFELQIQKVRKQAQFRWKSAIQMVIGQESRWIK